MSREKRTCERCKTPFEVQPHRYEKVCQRCRITREGKKDLSAADVERILVEGDRRHWNLPPDWQPLPP